MVAATKANVSHLHVKAGKQSLGEAVLRDLVEIDVENNRHLPDVATLRFHLDNAEGDITELPDKNFKDYLQQGTELEISQRENNKDKPIFKGEVISIGLEYGGWEPGGPMYVVIEAYDRTHRLHRGRKTRAFLNKKFSDIVSQVAQELGLKAVVDTTAGVHPYILQANQTDWGFVRQMADRVGYDLYVSDRELHFEKPQKAAGAPIVLNWGVDLLQFRMRATTAFQVPEVAVRGWDWRTQQAIVAKVSKGNGSPKIGEGRVGTAQAQGAFGKSEVAIVDRPVGTQSEAKAMAQALADDIASGHVYAEGVTTFGMGEILPGKQLRIGGVGTRFSGDYYVTSTTHHYTNHEGYSTSFVVGGRRTATLAESVDAGSALVSPAGFHGVSTAVVTNVEDPDDLMRVKVKFPWLDDQLESDWVRIASPDAGPDRGIQFLPEINDEVLVAFEHGDVNRPYIIGSLWNGKSKPPKGNKAVFKSGKVNERIIQSRTGHVVILDDTPGEEKIIIRDKSKKNEIIIDSKSSAMNIKIGKDINIEAGGKINIQSTRGDVAISCNNFSVSAKQKCEITANTQMTLEAKAQMSVKGAQTTVEGKSRVEVKGGAQTSIKAQGMVQVQSSGITQIKGALVKIN